MAAEVEPATRSRFGWAGIRCRITAVATVAVLAVLVLTGAGLTLAHRRFRVDELEETLRAYAAEVEAGLAANGVPDTLEPPGDDIVAQIVTEAGMVVAASPGVSRHDAIDGPGPGEVDSRRTVENLTGNGEAFRVLARTVDAPDGRLVLVVAGGLDDVRESTAALVRSLVIAIPLAVLSLALLVWYLVGRTLRPVEAIRSEVAVIGGSALDRRVPVPPTEDEIARLARTMNAMLDRIEEATERQRRFVADASHELRGPLARMRSELDVDRLHPDTADLTASHASVIEETEALQRLVDDLLLLARSDAGAVAPRRERVDLDDIVLREARLVRANGRVRVDASGVSAAQVSGDPGQLARAVRNLVENAARHAVSAVSLALSEAGPQAVLVVEDDGPGIPVDERARVFERFARLDAARNVGSGGTGLGLAITHDIVVRHGGTVSVEESPAGGARFVLTLPLEPVA
ncbi:MAG: HAMP domain-containing protein [Acidimicrobiia bacterium]|nr:HAMP domain-containing protein [Acidimicrobiia bacterium]